MLYSLNSVEKFLEQRWKKSLPFSAQLVLSDRPLETCRRHNRVRLRLAQGKNKPGRGDVSQLSLFHCVFNVNCLQLSQN